MSAAEALTAARVAGVRVGIDGDGLALEASGPPPPAILEALARHKAAIVTLLRPRNDGWTEEDWRAFFDERAGIAEFDGGLPRARAEVLAYDACVVEWLRQFPTRSGATAAPGAMGINPSMKFPDDFGKNGAD